jgi:hypothetical protein
VVRSSQKGLKWAKRVGGVKFALSFLQNTCVRMQARVAAPRHENAMTLLRIKRTQCPPMRPLSYATELPALVRPKRLLVYGRRIVDAGEAGRAVGQTQPSAAAAGHPHLTHDDPAQSISIFGGNVPGGGIRAVFGVGAVIAGVRNSRLHLHLPTCNVFSPTEPLLISRSEICELFKVKNFELS